MAHSSLPRSLRFMTSKCPACSDRLLNAFNNGSRRTIANTAYARQQAPAAKPTYTSTAKSVTTVKSPVAKAPATFTKPTSTASSSTTPTTAAAKVPNTTQQTPLTDPTQRRDLSEGLADSTPEILPNDSHVDWSRSFHGLSSTPFSKEAGEILMQPITPEDVEIKPDGVVYLPEIKYRRILNRAFGPGGWGLAPRGETIVTEKNVTREYGLVVHGRLVSISRGEQQYFDKEGIPTATEGCKSNALMRCCKDLGIASELWDPVFIRKFMASHSKQVWVEHAVTKKRKQITMRRDVTTIAYPFKEVKAGM